MANVLCLVGQFMQEHQLRDRKRDMAPTPPTIDRSTRARHADGKRSVAECELADAWLEFSHSWWEASWPDALLKAADAILSRTRALVSQCRLHLRHLPLECMAGTSPWPESPILRLVVAWSLHGAELLPLREWLSAVPELKCDGWGMALRLLHERRERGMPHGELLLPLLLELGAASGGEVELAPPEYRARSASILRHFVGSSARVAAAGFGPDPMALNRSAALVHAARSSSSPADVERIGRGQLLWAASQSAKREGVTWFESASHAARWIAARSERHATLCDAAEVSPEGEEREEREADGRLVLVAVRRLVSEVTSVLGEAALGRAAVETFASAQGTADAGRWLLLVAACHGALGHARIEGSGPAEVGAGRADGRAGGSAAAEEIEAALFEQARAKLTDDDERLPPLALLLLAAWMVHGEAPASDAVGAAAGTHSVGYAGWLQRLCAGEDGGAEGGAGSCLPPGGKRGVCRLLSAFSELVPILSTASLKLHMQHGRSWAAAHPDAADEHVALARTRLKDLEGDAPKDSAAEREKDEAEAAAIVEVIYERFGRSNKLPPMLPQLRFTKQKLWSRYILPRLLAPDTGGERAVLAHRLVRMLLKEKVISKADLSKTDASKGLRQRAGPACQGAADTRPVAPGTAPAEAVLPTDWQGLIGALPRVAAQPSRAVGSVAAGAHDGLCVALERTRALLRPTAAASSLSQVLQQILETFARCVAEAGITASHNWACPYVDKLLWTPQLNWPEFHFAFWGWLRLAVMGEAGADERLLALLMVHLLSLQRLHCARERLPPQACPTCDALMRLAPLSHRTAGGCQAESLLAQLPVSSPNGRAWTMRLGANCLSLVASSFEKVDFGRATIEDWAAIERVASPSKTGDSTGLSLGLSHAQCAWLPASLLQLLVWVDARSQREPVLCEAERRASAELRRSLELAGPSRLLSEIPAASERLHRLWEALSAPDRGDR